MAWRSTFSVCLLFPALAVAGCLGVDDRRSDGKSKEIIQLPEGPPTATPADPPRVSRSQQPEPERPAPVQEALPTPPGGRYNVSIRALVCGRPIFDDEVRHACYQDLLET